MVEAGHDTYDRIDLVVVSWNFIQQEQNPRLIIRKGIPASSPAVPSLVNDSSTIEIALARINVAKGAITLSDRNIVDLRGNDTYCPMVYDEQTIRNAFVNCVGYADGVKKISGFPNVTPTANDKILVENGGTGKSTTIKNAVNTCSLTLEEIQASTDLTGKVASASDFKIKNYNLGDNSFAIKFGRMCFIAFSGFNVHNVNILQLPSDLIPYDQFFTMIQHRPSNNNYNMGILMFTPTGLIQGWYQTSTAEISITSGSIYGTVCYICRN